jgi:hypothetical protein
VANVLKDLETIAGGDALPAVPTTARSVSRKAARRIGSSSEA